MQHVFRVQPKQFLVQIVDVEMRLTLSTILLISFVVLSSVLVANISNLIAIRIDNISDIYEPDESYGFSDRADVKSQNYINEDAISNSVAGDSQHHVMWFLQVSDIHISIFHDNARINDFREFCDRTLDIIKPSVVLATGDLTDAKLQDNMGSMQQLGEWEIYRNILNQTKVTEKTVWLDIRGNHDNFNIPSAASKLNYYREYTVQGMKHPHSYLYTMEVSGDKYGFLGIDACLSPGPKRPFNFIGMLNFSEIEHVKSLLNESHRKHVDYTITFGHYPTSCIISKSEESVRSLISRAPGNLAYLCGHFHMLGGLVPNMYTLQKRGFLELELADWKDNRIFRLGAVDHGLFSFIDVYHGHWPVILVTNPKHALYTIPQREPLFKILQSTHIRILVFSPSKLISVRIRLNSGPWLNCSHHQGALWTHPWDPKQFSVGLHNLDIVACDNVGRERFITQPFSLDGSRLEFNFWPRLMLMSNISMGSMFGLMLCLCVVPLSVFRIIHVLVKRRKLDKPIIRNRWILCCVRRLWILSTIDRLFYPLVVYALYLSIGPWTVGEVIDGHIGIVFAWGVMVNNSYLPGSFTYAYGFMQMCTFQLPLTLYLANIVDRRFQEVLSPRPASALRLLAHNLPFMVIISLQMVCAYFFWLAYGTLAFVIGPLRTWSIVLGIILWYLAITLPHKLFAEAALVWTQRTADYNSRESVS